MSEVEEMAVAVRKLHHASKGSLPCPIPMGVRIVEFRVVAEEDAEEIIKRADEAAATITRLSEALREAESEARRFAGFYDQGSDGRNTFVMLADKIAALTQGESSRGK